MTMAIQKDERGTAGDHGAQARSVEAGLTVAILAAGRPAYAKAFEAAGAHVLCADGAEAGMLVQALPDVVVIDAPEALTQRRIALLLAQLRWGCPDLVVMDATGMIGLPHAYSVDLGFDPALGPAHAADALAMARHLLCHSRLRDHAQTVTGAVSLLRREAPRRVELFR